MRSRSRRVASELVSIIEPTQCAARPKFISCIGSLESKLTPRCILLKRQISEIGIRKRQ
jgi:hypothetical protein